MREFNTSGPNFPDQHYTIIRENHIETGRQLVYSKKYFTVWVLPLKTDMYDFFR